MQKVNNILDYAQSDATYKSDMYLELLLLKQADENDIKNLFPDEEEGKAFQVKMESRFMTLIDETDELCFALDPNRDFLTVFKDKDESRRVKRDMMDFMRHNCMFDEKTVGRAMKEFDDFCHQRGEFAAHVYRNDPIVFWTQFDDLPIGELALRLFHMITSSASVERSFSVQKRLTGKLRNRLKQKRAEKMVAILFSDMENEQARSRRKSSKRRLDAKNFEGKDAGSLLIGPLAMAKADGDEEFAAELKMCADDGDNEEEEDGSDESDQEEKHAPVQRRTTIDIVPHSAEEEDNIPVLDADDVLPDEVDAADPVAHEEDAGDVVAGTDDEGEQDPNLRFNELQQELNASPSRRSRRKRSRLS